MKDHFSDARLPWHSLDTEEVATELKANIEQGLSTNEASNRLAHFGPNELKAEYVRPWYRILAHQFIDVLIFILLIAALMAFVLGERGDAIAILAILIVNGVLGFLQEWKAERAIDALRKMLSSQCSVMRDGRIKILDTRELVPGDLVSLEIGDRVPADLRLIDVVNLKVDESVLTGESESLLKQVASVSESAILSARASIAWMGTTVTNGSAKGLVIATGGATEFGRIAHLTQTVKREETPLQRKLAVLGKQLGLFAIAISVLIGVVGVFTGKSLMTMFFTAISLAVAVVPEGLPIVVTITMALGIRAMVQHRALLRRLQAAETLGAVTVICTDKTGTLTKNEMTVTTIGLPAERIAVTGVGYDPAGHFEIEQQKIEPAEHPELLALLETGLICNHATLYKEESGWKETGEPTEAALITAAYKAKVVLGADMRRVSEFSFNSQRKRMTVITQQANKKIAHVKGAPEIILERCTHQLINGQVKALTEKDRQALDDLYLQMAKQGLRTLALARREIPDDLEMKEDLVEQQLTFLGIVGIIDPPRREVSSALAVAREAGIRTIMITGDAAATAQAIAERIGLDVEKIVTGMELEVLSDQQLIQILKHPVLFARVSPEHKLKIVQLLQKQDQIVGMTGDGVNDAPALKKANVGIAMGIRGTDVAKSAADVVLTDDNFASIIRAVKEGRRQYMNIQKFVRYLLSSNMGEVVAIFLNIVLGGPLILMPVQILWMNLITDGVTSLALGVEPSEKGIMNESPRPVGERILNRRGLLFVLLLGGYIGCVTLLLFRYYLHSADLSQRLLAQTMAFTGIILLEKVNVFNFRSFKQPVFRLGFFSNPWLLLAVSSMIGLQACAIYVPFLQHFLHTAALGWKDWGLMLLVSLPLFVSVEVYKSFHR
ncbi:MAG: HAD-IC family P-type ATPase [Pseudomonadota bacterium]|nr:HAD-IC family P-type ATPase [Gammaproteobacteria bacterium]MBU1558490.1 HAD-IC family P-type ATPase [Gammaproteobacteria bacterium]MBU1628937.1 HAD-IC family P-type ATPase [Gammaproteobacteria bacterium]MBU1926326.1 HAD-IC family P-type ATPase [Gammaproteobacteria bacterium]MBU2545855.1 HAD-IC family P-type ATPase [Gammaproteobacteria bacterium]